MSATAKELWLALAPQTMSHPAGLARLNNALLALDRADSAAAVIAEEGMISVTPGTGAKHAHPLLQIELECRKVFEKYFAKFWTKVDRSSADPAGAGPGRSASLGPADLVPLSDEDLRAMRLE